MEIIFLAGDYSKLNKIGSFLKKAGHEVVFTNTAQLALEWLNRKNFDVLVFDLEMPGVIGLELIDAIKKRQSTCAVLLLSSRKSRKEAIEAMKDGAMLYLYKPVDTNEFFITLDKIRRIQRLERDNIHMTQQLQRLKNEHQVLLNSVPCNISVQNRRLEVIHANDFLRDKIGDSLGRYCYEAYKGLDKPCEDCSVIQTFKDAQIHSREEVGRDKNGEPAYFLVHSAPIVNEFGEVESVLEMSTDITEIKQIQNELRLSKENYETIFNNVPCYITVQNRNFEIIEANEQFKKTLDVDPVGKYCYNIYKGGDHKCEDCIMEKTFADGGTYSREETIRGKEGKLINLIVYTAPIRNANGSIVSAIEISADITELKKTRAELKGSKEFQNKLIESSLDAIVAVDKHGRIITFNQAASEIFGYSSEEATSGITAKQIYPPEYTNELNEAGTLGPRLIISQETFVSDRSGENIPVRFSRIPLWENGEVIGSLEFYQDLREVKKLEQEKRQYERLATVGQTIAGLAHGIKNIIACLEGGVYVVQSGMRRDKKELMTQGWDMVERNLDKISNLVMDLLNYSKELTLKIEKLDPNDIIREVAELHKERAQNENIELITEFDNTVNNIYADYDGIHTCMVNLVSNALDACLADNDKASHQVKITARNGKSDSVLFEVTDNGIGMDEDTKNKLFESFFTTKGSHGTGLGLLVTRKIVQDHHGFIDVQSEPGASSTFSVEFPLGAPPLTE